MQKAPEEYLSYLQAVATLDDRPKIEIGANLAESQEVTAEQAIDTFKQFLAGALPTIYASVSYMDFAAGLLKREPFCWPEDLNE